MNTYSWKIKAGIGVGYGLSYSLMGGISLDKHGKTHWMAQNYKYGINQNLYDSSTNPAFEIGVDIGASMNLDRNWQSDRFTDALRSSSSSVNISDIPRFSLKGLAGGSIGGGDRSFSLSFGLGLSAGCASDPYFIIESISISAAEEATLKSGFSHWAVVNQKYNKTTNTFQGFLKVGNTTTNIKVSCSSVNVNGKSKPDRIWTSTNYLQD